MTSAFEEGQQASVDLEPASSPIHSGVDFIRKHSGKVLAISVALAVPCFWHKHIEAGDLPSHLYNAWLTTLIERGQAPGLYLARQWNNILFDTSLTRLGAALGFNAAEKIVVCATALIFFWGAFALIGAISRRAPWVLVPAIAMITYGWTFHAGFDNYYLSVALAFWSVALLWDARGWNLLPGLAVVLLALLAHPLGFLLAIGLIVYVVSAKLLPRWWAVIPPAGSVALVWAARAYIAHHFEIVWPVYHFLVNGVDQVILGSQYKPLARALLVVGAVFLLLDAILRRKDGDFWRHIVIPSGLYVASMAAVLLLPEAIAFPQYARPFNVIAMRLTLISATFALAVLGCLRPRVWHLVAFSAAAIVFFFFLWHDTSKIADLEDQAEQLVAQLPPGERVIATLYPPGTSRFYFLNHIVDRACIGRCFSYANYEPSTLQFRVRALPGNRIVTDSARASDEMQLGIYVVQPQDMPVAQISRCSPNSDKLCVAQLQAGQTNGSAFPQR
jgi:hypothetical protein